jgi:hypothetical protein
MMMHKQTRERDLGNILVSGRNYISGHVRDRKQVKVALSETISPLQLIPFCRHPRLSSLSLECSYHDEFVRPRLGAPHLVSSPK